MFLDPNQIRLDRTNHGAGVMDAAEGLANEFKSAFDRESIDKGIRQITDRMFDNKPMSQQEMSDALLALPARLRPDIIDGFQKLQGVDAMQREMAINQGNIVLDAIGSAATALADVPETDRPALFKELVAQQTKLHGSDVGKQMVDVFGGNFSAKKLFNVEVSAGTSRHATGIVQEQTQSRQRIRDAQLMSQAGATQSQIQKYSEAMQLLTSEGYPKHIAIPMAMRAAEMPPNEALVEAIQGADLSNVSVGSDATAPEGSQGAAILAGEKSASGTTTGTANPEGGASATDAAKKHDENNRQGMADLERIRRANMQGGRVQAGGFVKGEDGDSNLDKAAGSVADGISNALREKNETETKSSLLRPRQSVAQEINDAQNFMNYMGVPKETQKDELKRIAVENRDRLSEEGKGSIEGAASKSVENLSAGAEMALRVLKEAGSAAHEAAPPQVQKAMDKVAQKAGGLGAAAFGKLIEAGKRLGLDKSQIISELKRIAEAMAKGASPERMAAEGRR